MIGSAARFGWRSSPVTSSRLISSEIRKKKSVIRPSLTQWPRLSSIDAPPIPMFDVGRPEGGVAARVDDVHPDQRATLPSSSARPPPASARRKSARSRSRIDPARAEVGGFEAGEEEAGGGSGRAVGAVVDPGAEIRAPASIASSIARCRSAAPRRRSRPARLGGSRRRRAGRSTVGEGRGARPGAQSRPGRRSSASRAGRGGRRRSDLGPGGELEAEARAVAPKDSRVAGASTARDLDAARAPRKPRRVGRRARKRRQSARRAGSKPRAPPLRRTVACAGPTPPAPAPRGPAGRATRPRSIAAGSNSRPPLVCAPSRPP